MGPAKHLMRIGVHVPKSAKVYVSFGAFFEKPRAIDPSCSKTTVRIQALPW